MLSHFSHVQLFATLETIACQAHLSMVFSMQEYWNGWPFPSPENLPNPGIKLASLMSPALTGRFFITSTTWEALNHQYSQGAFMLRGIKETGIKLTFRNVVSLLYRTKAYLIIFFTNMVRHTPKTCLAYTWFYDYIFSKYVNCRKLFPVH